MGTLVSHDVEDAADDAKRLGADAIIVLGQQRRYTGTYSTGSATAYGAGNTASAYGSGVSIPIFRSEAGVAVIKWKQPTEPGTRNATRETVQCPHLTRRCS